MLNYTGHPLVDVGAATIAAFAGRRDPTKLTAKDLGKMADYIERNYVVDPLKSFLTVVFPNSGFTQPAFEKTPKRRTEYARLVTRSYQMGSATQAERCVFTGLPAGDFVIAEELGPGRVARSQIPLLTGNEVINFFPDGDAGLPISGEALLCIQAFPLGCAKVAGRLLAAHSNDPELIYAFAKGFLNYNLKSIDLAQHARVKKLAESKFTAGTLLIQTLLDADAKRLNANDDDIMPAASLTAYHLSNIGQSPSLEIYVLPLQVMRFLRMILSASYATQWDKVVKSAWQIKPEKKVKAKKGKEANTSPKEDKPRRNYLYEDVLHLYDDPRNIREFLRRYFLRKSLRYAREGDPRRNYSTFTDIDLISWTLTELFLKEVMAMDSERIKHIRDLGDRFATYINKENDRRFFRAVFGEQNYNFFRTALIKADTRAIQLEQPPLITFDQFIEVFENGEDSARPDWRLARDLVLIRMIEQLHAQGWLGRNPDVIPERVEPLAEEESNKIVEE